MICPVCNSEKSKVLESRKSSYGIRRRRECLDCGNRFTTLETIIKKQEKRKLKNDVAEEITNNYDGIETEVKDDLVSTVDLDEQEFLQGYLKGKI